MPTPTKSDPNSHRSRVSEWQAIVRKTMDDSESSQFAKIIAYTSIAMIVLSTATYCLETEPQIVKALKISTLNQGVLFIFETIVIAWFSLEYIFRLFSYKNKREYVLSFMGILDLFVILPYYIDIMFSRQISRHVIAFATLRLLRMARMIRIFRLGRYNKGLIILGKTIKRSLGQLGALLLFMLLNVIMWSSIIYYMEYTANAKSFDSIPSTFWFVMITMTTVGYGDMVPVTGAGKLASAFCMLSGIITLLCLPTPVFICHFSSFYSGRTEDPGDSEEKKQVAGDESITGCKDPKHSK